MVVESHGELGGGRWEACFSHVCASIQFLSPHGIMSFLFRQEVIPEETAVPHSGGSVRIEKTPGALPHFTPHTGFISYIDLTAGVCCFIAHVNCQSRNQICVVVDRSINITERFGFSWEIISLVFNLPTRTVWSLAWSEISREDHVLLNINVGLSGQLHTVIFWIYLLVYAFIMKNRKLLPVWAK